MRAAFVFLSRIPLGGFPYRDADWRWAAAHFPLVGIVVGGVSAAVYASVSALGASTAATLALLTSVVLTGAFHEDGLADSADALGGTHSGKGLFEILKDSRIGTYGAVALFASLSLRVVTIAELDNPYAIVLAACIARTPPVAMIASLPYVTAAGAKGRLLTTGGWLQAVVALLWPAALIVGLLAVGKVSASHALAALVSPFAMALLLGLWFRSRASGITGDFLGATEQVGEVTVLLVLLSLQRLAL